MHNTIQWLNCVVRYLNVKKTKNWLRKLMHNFVVHSNESACRKSGRLGLEQVTKTSHRDKKVATTIIDLISYFYGREYPLTFNLGKVHEYLGMTIEFSKKGKVKFTMYDYIYDMFEDIP